LDCLCLDQVSLDAIEGLTEATNKLTEAIKEVNTIRVYGDGEDGVKIWPKGEVKIVNPIIAKLPSKQQSKGLSANQIRQRFANRR
jgi:hypothetical protein